MNWSPEETAKLVKLYADGATHSQVAAALGRSEPSVRQRRAALSTKPSAFCGCGAGLGPKNTTGLCRPCAARQQHADPVKAAARRAGFQAYLDLPGTRAELADRLTAARNNPSPEEIERRRERGRQQYERVLLRPDVVAKCAARKNSPEARAIISRKAIARMLPWCPEPYRRAYHALVKKRFSTAEAKAIILAQVARDEARRLAALSYKDRIAEQLRAGARVVPRFVPSRVHAVSLTGSSMADVA